MATKETFSKLFPDTWFFAGDVAGLSNMTMGSLRYSNSRNAIEVEYDYNYKRAYDTEVTYSRSLTRFLEIYAGGNFEREKGEKKAKNKGIIGVHYVLPMLIEANLRLNSDAKLRLSLGSELQLTERTKLEWSWNTNHDYRGVLSYEIKKNILLSATYDSDFRWGAGLRVKF